LKQRTSRYFLSFLFLIFALSPALAQGASTGSDIFIYVIIGLIAILALFGLIQVADSFLRIEADRIGADKSGANYSIFPRMDEIFKPKLPEYAANEKVHILKKGHNINLEGAANGAPLAAAGVKTYAVQPTDFIGLSPIPKVEPEVGGHVKAGDVLFYDKKDTTVKYVAPVSGEVIAINRGAKRAISEIVIAADSEQQYRTYTLPNLAEASRENLVTFLLESGAWPMIRQRPFNVIADYKEVPKNIFVSTFDTAPLAPDLNRVVVGKTDAFQKGLDVLNKLTEGKVHLGLNAGGAEKPSAVFTEAQGVELNWFNGPHPSGNVGVQIHHVDPINAQDKVWTLGVQEVISLGSLFLDGKYNAERVVALTGAELKEPKYVNTFLGANIGELLKDNLSNDHIRYISGDVLSGKTKTDANFVNFYDDQVTVVEEGDQYEMFGWLLPIAPRPSISRTFPTNFLFDQEFKANTNTHGEERAFVVTGQYESMLPMDVYPQHLMKAIMMNDFERMEGLGLYELVEEDIALCEFACTSKQPLQEILREGLDVLREQG